MLQQIGKYRIEGVLGHGAMGIVYRGIDPSLDRVVAIKTIHPHLLTGPVGEELLQRFKTEATAAARCQHSNIVTVYEFGQHEDTPYIAMEFVSGRGLDDIMKQQASLPLKRINSIFIGVCRGLNYAHQRGIVHRDIKPANVMVLDGDAVKLADFGIAKMPTSEMTQIGTALGTPSYMSPEQRQGAETDQRTDIFALGVVMFELLAACQEIPEALRTHAVAAVAELPATAKLNSSVAFPKSIADFLNQCLSASTKQRFGTVAQVLEAYKVALQNMRGDSTGSTRSEATNADATQIRQERTLPQPEPEEEELPEEEKFIRKSLSALEATRALKAVDPVLNSDWQEKIVAALAQFDAAARERACKNILEPKNIKWSEIAKKFVFEGHPTLHDLGSSLTTIPLTTLASKLDQSLKALKTTRNTMVIADTLEGGISAIERYNPEDNITRHKEKQKLLEAFLYDAAICVQGLDFDLPPNRRGLTVDGIKTYIIQVFIKQQVMKYWFVTTPVRELEQHPTPFVSKFVAAESKVRRFDIVNSDHYYFLIGPVPRSDQNQYSVRRFLSEDTALGGSVCFFNGLAVDKRDLTSPGVQDKLRGDIARVVTIQRQLSQQIIDLVDNFELVQRKYLLPLLFKPIEADGTSLEMAVERRLQEYEKNLCRLVLGKIPRALKEFVRGPDDFEYLLMGLKALLIELLGNVRDFSYLSTAQWSEKTQELEFKIGAYLRLLEKRKASLMIEEDAVLEPALDPDMPMAELKQLVEDVEPKLEDLKAKLKEAMRQAAEEQTKTQQMLTRIFRPGRTKLVPDDIRKEIATARDGCFLGIVRLSKKYPKITVYLEFEDLAPLEGPVRHYAFPAGDMGLSLLPLLAQLPENREDFSVKQLRDVLEFDLFKASQKWTAGATA